MSDGTGKSHSSDYAAAIGVAGFELLAQLALDIRSTWNHASDTIWRRLDPTLWELTQNPWVVLQTVSRQTLEQALADDTFHASVTALLDSRRIEAESPAWFQQTHAQKPLRCVAYFSMEFMLSEALPIYSGGLGNVAGDHLKAASDLGIPVVGVGLLYQQGYFRQAFGKDGMQQALYPYNDPGQLPVTPLRKPDGEWLRLEIALPGYSVWLRAWQVQVGRVKLYLLDSNDAANYPVHRGITSELYGGNAELRLKQELVLGIGGWRLLRALGLEPDICHLNEGHVAFAILERARDFMRHSGLSFAQALSATRAGNVFTTHTAVAAGFDRFAPELIAHYLADYAQTELAISLPQLLALGRIDGDNAGEPFNMAWLAIRGSAAVNAVSSLHGAVSRELFAPLFPRWPLDEVPVGHVTNGVHMPTWDSALADRLWTHSCGKQRWQGTVAPLGENIRCVDDAELWQFRCASRQSLVEFANQRLARQLPMSGIAADVAGRLGEVLDGDTLTLGFARRFADYKRPNLLLHDPERLVRILTHPQRPLQLIIAGKAHPDDHHGQRLIQQWIRFIWRPEVRRHVIFLADYDMHMTEHLVQGVDVWLNTPRRPWEACGTSGMKVLVNGGLNLSVQDGWWAEAYAPEVGWALGDGHTHSDERAADAADAEALYTLLEQQVIPEFYTRDTRGVPLAWVARVRESMARLTPQFSTNRSAVEYTQRYYIPLAERYHQRVVNNGAGGVAIERWRTELARHWQSLRFGDVRYTCNDDRYIFDVQIYLDGLSPHSVCVELYAAASDGFERERIVMQCTRELVGAAGSYEYCASVPARRPAHHYTPRVIPAFDGVVIPLEAAHILWQR